MRPWTPVLSRVAIFLFIFTAALSGSVTRAADAPASAPSLPTSVPGLIAQLPDETAATRKAVIDALSLSGDQRLTTLLDDLSEGNLYLWKNQVVACPEFTGSGKDKSGLLLDPLTRNPIQAGGKQVAALASDLKEISASRKDRMLVRDALTMLHLTNPKREERLAAVIKSGEGAVAASLPGLHKLQTTEKDPDVLAAVKEAIALIALSNADTDPAAAAARLDAAQTLGQMRSSRALERLQNLASTDNPNAIVYNLAITRIQNWQSVVQWAGNIFSGLSASSILILMALGLSIIFGLMGVINMAHGELMMIGAYATFLTQQVFVNYLPPGAFDWFFIAAIPVSFVAAALVGILIEATVIRYLYGRPLDTLLATLGVGLVLIQFVRVFFGNNRSVSSPTWLRGSFEIMQDIHLPYNRVFIIGFCLGCIALMYFIVEKTKLGLLLRATTQNRQMAAALGVSTRKIDMLTFGLGAGLAGLAGCALTQIGGVTPDMGQNYIVDSFLVVVTGGVGKLAGAICSGFGLGMTNKLLEPFFGTVWAKVLILILVVAFIQRRPSGLFPAKGRLADV